LIVENNFLKITIFSGQTYFILKLFFLQNKKVMNH